MVDPASCWAETKPWSAADLAEGSRIRFVREWFKPDAMIGFRCARSARPRLTAADFVRRLDDATETVASNR